MLLRRSVELTLIAVFAFVVAGCTDGNSGYTEVDPHESEAANDDHGDHGHGSHGPNGGEIVELGNEEFHAEFVVDESTHRIDVFILGSDAKTAKPIDATEISLSFKHGDVVEEFKLAAVTQDGDPEGQASKFTLSSEDAFGELHEHSEGATLSFTVGEESLTGKVVHSHEHGHDHGPAHDHGDGDHEAGHKHDEGHGDKDVHSEAGGKDNDDSKNGPVKPAGEPAH